MDLSNLPLFGAGPRKGQGLSERQRVLLKSIAYPSAPHYRAPDPRPLEFKHAPASAGHRRPAAIDLQPPSPARSIPRIGEAGEASPRDDMVRPAASASDDHLKSSLYRKPIGRSV